MKTLDKIMILLLAAAVIAALISTVRTQIGLARHSAWMEGYADALNDMGAYSTGARLDWTEE